MEIEEEIQRETHATFGEKCKLGVFLAVCISTVIYVGFCLRTIFTIPFYYSAQPCDE